MSNIEESCQHLPTNEQCHQTFCLMDLVLGRCVVGCQHLPANERCHQTFCLMDLGLGRCVVGWVVFFINIWVQ